MTAADRLDEIEARVNAATEGPWDFDGLDDLGAYYVRRGWSVVTEHAIEEDATFIASTRADIPALVVALRSVLALHRPSNNDTQRSPLCTTCHGRAGVWECGCWAEEDSVPVCSSCTNVEPVHNSHGATPWPCPTVATITAALEVTS